MKDFSNYQFRASQGSKLLVGTIGVTDIQIQEIKDLEKERDTGYNINGNKVKWTNPKQLRYDKLVEARDNPRLPATVETELRKIYRAETYNRNFEFTNKYVQKGIDQEEEAITVLQSYLLSMGIRVLFRKNEETFSKGKWRGTPDISPVILSIDGKKKKIGFDTKASWSLETFPFPEDKLEIEYDTQNRIYTKLTGADMWITAHVLVNVTEDLLHKEKMKWFYANGAPEEQKEPFKYGAYIQKCKELEKQLIFDYNKFVHDNPGHILEYTPEEWHGEGNDIPLNRRVVMKATYPDPEKWAELEARAEIGIKHLIELQKQEESENMVVGHVFELDNHKEEVKQLT